jgi:hypothetical protein
LHCKLRETLALVVPLFYRANTLFQKNIYLSSLRELACKPLELLLDTSGTRARQHVVKKRNRCARSPQTYPHLMDSFSIEVAQGVCIGRKMPERGRGDRGECFTG